MMLGWLRPVQVEGGAMAREADVRKAFEAILGRDLETDVGDEVLLREAVAVWTVIENDASITSREIGTTGSSTKACRGNVNALDVGGTARTTSNGTVKFRLSDFYCGTGGKYFLRPINFVGTCQSKAAVFLTSFQTLTASFDDVEITAFAWDANGKPQAVTFDWRCFVPYVNTVD
jgi:hypothetical protein